MPPVCAWQSLLSDMNGALGVPPTANAAGDLTHKSAFLFRFSLHSAVIPAGVRLERRVVGAAISASVGPLDRLLGFASNLLGSLFGRLRSVLGRLDCGLADFLGRGSRFLGGVGHGVELRERGAARHTERGHYQC